ncbi:MAG: hypothetical protein ACXVRJ_09685 [Gaiellaceae bacterium]
MIASLVDQATNLADQSTSYPLFAKVVFVVTLVLALVSIFVYALLFPSTADGEQPPEVKEPAG